MKVRRSALKDTVVVATHTGEGAYGPVDGTPVTVRCLVDETRRLVRDASGDEAVSESTLLLHPRTQVVDGDGRVVALVDPMTVFTPESPVTISGRKSRVLSAKQTKIRNSVLSVEVTCA
ncbi:MULTISPECIES: hypothetical protein [unclassified Nocardioides]|uniref:hypothetical protein n=1 Tax=unclassified Nocardioides TaxID=2615069 RepID=UPI0009F14EED|nr:MULTISPECIES: hypothetical protein [unclassified Nocardioides]GAW50611.1 Putative uncharacterized protein [Nocardioides sp. PD653-B2]GAW55510.1 putative uncharacterized protein [Nocardioides sp. PD653]